MSERNPRLRGAHSTDVQRRRAPVLGTRGPEAAGAAHGDVYVSRRRDDDAVGDRQSDGLDTFGARIDLSRELEHLPRAGFQPQRRKCR